MGESDNLGIIIWHHVTSQGDGEDLTSKIRQLKLESICLLNIPSYGSGTNPWGNPSSRDQVCEVWGVSVVCEGVRVWEECCCPDNIKCFFVFFYRELAPRKWTMVK